MGGRGSSSGKAMSVADFQNLRGENKGKRKTGLIKDLFLWNDKSKSVQSRISPIMK